MSTNKTIHRPKRILSGGFTLAVTVGGVIGLGILRTPGEIASVAPQPWLFVTLWILGGLFALLSTVVASELIAMTPRSGGTYSLVRRAYGPFPGFVIGWADWLCFVADIALKAVVVTEFATLLLPEIEQWQMPLSILVSTVFAALQLRGLGLGAKIQQFAAAAMALIVVGFTLALVFAGSNAGLINEVVPVQTSTGKFATWSLVFASLVYAYDGWIYAAYFSGEIKGGGRAIVRASIRGIIVVIIIYVFLVSVMAWKVPLTSLEGNELALAKALELVISPQAATAVLVAAIVMTLAHQNVLYMSTPRIIQALAVDGLAIKKAGEISKGGNPIFAVVLSWALSVGLIIIGGFEFLLHLTVFFHLIVYVLLIAGVIILRKRQPDVERPYRAWGHPWSTMICLLGWIFLSIFQAVVEVETAIYAVIMIMISWPVFRFLIRSKKADKGK